jgi:uncharacterized membrane protein YciS (DUF1049 family)
MWVVRAVLIALVVVIVVAFAFYNVGTEQRVAINLIWAKYVDVPLTVVVFWSFVAGVAVSLVLFVTVYLRQALDLRSARRRVRGLEQELTVLRNRPIEESADLLKGKDSTDIDIESPFSGDRS